MPPKVQKGGMTTHSQWVANIPPTPTGSVVGQDQEEGTVTQVPIEVTIGTKLVDQRMYKPMKTEWEWVGLIQLVSMEVKSVSMD